MDILKQMTLARAQAGISNALPDNKTTRIQGLQRVKSLRERRADICENKPKAKIVLEYFKDLIQNNLDSSSEDDA